MDERDMEGTGWKAKGVRDRKKNAGILLLKVIQIF
jgi:hypothetical protein